MMQTWIALAEGVTVTTCAHAALDEAAAEALMKKDGCAGCHEIDKKLVGPAFQDVAAKYKGDRTQRSSSATRSRMAACTSGERPRCRRMFSPPIPISTNW